MTPLIGSVGISRDVSLTTLVFFHTSSSSQTGYYGCDIAKAQTRLSLNCSAPGVLNINRLWSLNWGCWDYPSLYFRAPSKRKLHALKWRVFTSWCSGCQLDPVKCCVVTVMEFL